MSVFGGVSRAIRLPPGWRPGAMGARGRRRPAPGAFADLLGGALRRHGGLPDAINLLIDALVDQEDLHVMIMDVISAPPDEFAVILRGGLHFQVLVHGLLRARYASAE